MKIEEAMTHAKYAGGPAYEALRREVLRLRKDKERLDFFQSNGSSAWMRADGWFFANGITTGFMTVRAAIDAAMKSSPSRKKR